MGLFYQFYVLIKDYLNYNIVIEVNVFPISRIIPSVTVCVNKSNRLSNEFIEKQINPFNKTILCFYKLFSRELEDCDEDNKQIYVRYKKDSVCLTLVNQMDELSNQSFPKIVLVNAVYHSAQVILHPHYSPSHFERHNIFKVKYPLGTEFQVKKTMKTLLPLPHSTDCFDYSYNQQNNIRPKSQNDCKLELMRRKEQLKCNHNNYWNEDIIDNNKQVLNFSKIFDNCSVKVDDNFLNRKCKKDCEITEYSVKEDKIALRFLGSIAYIVVSNSFYLHLTYTPKMDLIAFFSNFGGLQSMWLGMGAIDLARLFSRLFSLILSLTIYKVRKFHFLAKIQYFIVLLNKFLYMFCLSLMLYQLIGITKSFIYSEMIEITFRSQSRIPTTTLVIFPSIDRQRNSYFYPEFIKNLKANNNQVLDVMHEFFIDMLSMNISLLEYMTRSDQISLKCFIKFNGNVIMQCPKPQVIINTSVMKSFSVSYLFFNDISGDFWKNYSMYSTVKQVNLELSFNVAVVSSMLTLSNSILNNYVPNRISQNIIFPNCVNNLIFETSFVRRKHLFNGNKCKNGKINLFVDNINDQMIIDCINRENNRIYDCLPAFGTDSWIRVDRDLNELQYKICSKETNVNQSIIQTNIRNCVNSIEADCEIQMFDVFNYYKPNHQMFSTQINIIPKYNLITEYKQKHRMDWSDWLYNCGGIVGIWFGWSALSVSTIIVLIGRYLSKVISKLKMCYKLYKIQLSKVLQRINYILNTF